MNKYAHITSQVTYTSYLSDTETVLSHMMHEENELKGKSGFSLTEVLLSSLIVGFLVFVVTVSVFGIIWKLRTA